LELIFKELPACRQRQAKLRDYAEAVLESDLFSDYRLVYVHEIKTPLSLI
jgi:hypothetical protein